MSDYVKTLLTCSICGENASVNTPGIDDKGNIACHNCLPKLNDDIMRYGIKQRSDSFGGLIPDDNHHRFYNGGTLVFYPNQKWELKFDIRFKDKIRFGIGYPMYDVKAYTNDGAVFPLTYDEMIEAIKNPMLIFEKFLKLQRMEMFRCTDCNNEFYIGDIGGRPLFAGKVCKKCWNLHLLKLEREKIEGKICRNCGECYSNCCC